MKIIILGINIFLLRLYYIYIKLEKAVWLAGIWFTFIKVLYLTYPSYEEAKRRFKRSFSEAISAYSDFYSVLETNYEVENFF